MRRWGRESGITRKGDRGMERNSECGMQNAE